MAWGHLCPGGTTDLKEGGGAHLFEMRTELNSFGNTGETLPALPTAVAFGQWWRDAASILQHTRAQKQRLSAAL